MFKFRNTTICGLLVALYLWLPFSQPQAAAGIFDRVSPTRKAAAAAEKPSEARTDAPYSLARNSRGRVSLTSYAEDNNPESPVTTTPNPAIPAESFTVIPSTAAPFEMSDNSCHCINCGQDDHCQSCLRHCRKRCKQTWYPRAAPYCQPGWGWNQPCWRRTQDAYNCPRPQQMTAPRRRIGSPESPAAGPPVSAPIYEVIPETSPDDATPEVPEPPRESAGRR